MHVSLIGRIRYFLSTLVRQNKKYRVQELCITEPVFAMSIITCVTRVYMHDLALTLFTKYHLLPTVSHDFRKICKTDISDALKQANFISQCLPGACSLHSNHDLAP